MHIDMKISVLARGLGQLCGASHTNQEVIISSIIRIAIATITAANKTAASTFGFSVIV
jgi:hypothetical protein